jgi:hypothetical protein
MTVGAYHQTVFIGYNNFQSVVTGYNLEATRMRLIPALKRWVTLNAMRRDEDTRLSRHTGARC